MDRRTTISTAAGITLTAAALAAAIGVSLGIMSDKSSAEGPGTFQPTAELLASTKTGMTTSTVASTSSTTVTPEVESVGVDGNGNKIVDANESHEKPEGHDADD